MHIYNLFHRECSFSKRLYMSFLISIIFVLIFPIYSKAEIQTVTKKIYHVHSGDSSRLAGCYTVPKTTTITYDEECSGKMVYFPDYNKSQCNFCGAAADGDQSYRKCYTTKPVTVSTTVYELGCNKSTTTALGTFSVTPDTEEWTKEVILTMELSLASAVKKNSHPFTVNGAACNEYTYTATANGDYTVKLNCTSTCNASAAVVTITNIDNTAPVLTSYSLSTSEWTTQPVTVSLNGVADLQPDGSNGCGLHDQPYSYDGGQTWTNDSTHTFSSNSSLTVMLRDRLGNTSSPSIEVGNIDNEAPRIISIDFDNTPNVKSVTLSVTADDVMSDGRGGSGLHESAYSFDNGQNWQNDNTYTVSKCGRYSVWVRDRLGNTSKESVEVSNIDCYGPLISYKLSPSGKTTGSVTATITVTDTGYNNGPGIGLPEEYLSFDDGATWTSENTVKTTKNIKVPVISRDLNGNISKAEIAINNIVRPGKPAPDPSPDNSGDDNQDPAPADPEPEPVTPKEPPKVVPPTPDKPKPVKPAVTVNPPATPTKTAKQVKEKPTPKVTKAVIPQPVLKSQNVSDMDNLDNTDTGNDGFKKFIIVMTGICSTLLTLLLLAFLFFRMVFVYNLESKTQYAFRGICLIKKRDTFEFTISQNLLDSCQTGQFRFRFSSLFAALHKEDNIVIYLPDKQSYIVQAKKEIELTVKL